MYVKAASSVQSLWKSHFHICSAPESVDGRPFDVFRAAAQMPKSSLCWTSFHWLFSEHRKNTMCTTSKISVRSTWRRKDPNLEKTLKWPLSLFTSLNFCVPPWRGASRDLMSPLFHQRYTAHRILSNSGPDRNLENWFYSPYNFGCLELQIVLVWFAEHQTKWMIPAMQVGSSSQFYAHQLCGCSVVCLCINKVCKGHLKLICQMFMEKEKGKSVLWDWLCRGLCSRWREFCQNHIFHSCAFYNLIMKFAVTHRPKF